VKVTSFCSVGTRGVVVRGQLAAFAACILAISLSGCALQPKTIIATTEKPVAERETLVKAARVVEAAPWPKPENASMFSFLTGDDGKERVPKSDAVSHYVSSLTPEGRRFETLTRDAEQKLADAQGMRRAALLALDAQHLTMNDVALVEKSIQNMREQRSIFVEAADELGDVGEPVNEASLRTIRMRYSTVIKAMGDAADLLADKIADDDTTTFARARNNDDG